MTLETKAKNTIYARTYLTMTEQIRELLDRNGDERQPTVVIVCNGKCNQQLRDSETKILICGEFRCRECFGKLVLSQKIAFGFPDEPTEDEPTKGDITDKDINELLVPFEHILIPNLYEPKETPRFVCTLDLPNA